MSFEGFLLFLILKKRNGRDSNHSFMRLISNDLIISEINSYNALNVFQANCFATESF